MYDTASRSSSKLFWHIMSNGSLTAVQFLLFDKNNNIQRAPVTRTILIIIIINRGLVEVIF